MNNTAHRTHIIVNHPGIGPTARAQKVGKSSLFAWLGVGVYNSNWIPG
jgi:hypothetical protein